ncbi:GNAT family N-acetyltransferase [Methylococcus sp. EFPC2]|uniref:GNAT family N-acetyltransferase n=1 Tax=Methylococcus sp. EFPC2 TaxID=2812648 RepID=UPI0019683BCB|nr:GNAT family N-acetyltransferase [Methylococcus sp. EFPC2]QSA95971.1 GNAT family N-acetyltransferase [Methylococcus sp. EFPC2]
MRAILLEHAHDLPEADWNALDTDDDPFINRAFLGIAEQTGAADEGLGWRPLHLTLRDDHDRLTALLPLYLRSHSFGDFSQDWHWPSAWRQAGLDYYPKLVTGVPFTPSPGPRLLTRAEPEVSAAPTLIAAALDLVQELGVSSWQCLFAREADHGLLESAGLLLRRGVQFHWFNRGYRDFTDFLETFNAEKRKKVKRERRQVSDAGLRIEVRHGDEIDASLWKAIHRHYRDTFSRYGNHPAFSLEFFQRVGAALARRMVVFVAWRDEQPVASAICYRNGAVLFGRHWGTDIDSPGLHFELCYYSGIEYAIAHGLRRFEPGAQGEHKLARGFEPAPTWSAFWIADPRMRRAVADFLAREDTAVQDYEAEMAERLPYKIQQQTS